MNPAQLGDDIDQIMAVMETAFEPRYGEAWNRRQVTDALLLGNYDYLLAGGDGHPPRDGQPACGFIMSRRAADEEELLLLAVMPQARGTGIGRCLIERFKQSAIKNGVRHLFLEMRQGNSAETLYRAAGFNIIGQRPDYYRCLDGHRISAITFGLNL